MSTYMISLICKRQDAAVIRLEVGRVFGAVRTHIEDPLDTGRYYEDIRMVTFDLASEQNQDDEFSEPYTIDGPMLQGMIDRVIANTGEKVLHYEVGSR